LAVNVVCQGSAIYLGGFNLAAKKIASRQGNSSLV
jgi:hypothetical protein